MKDLRHRFGFIISIVISLFLAFSLPVIGYSQKNDRTEIRIPDIPGYFTIRCDFHMHTVYSDGSVWPRMRAIEAWAQGLDAMAITDHAEYFRKDLKGDQNSSYDRALLRATQLGLILIRGIEITKSNPPGHLNAIFLEDANPLHNEDYKIAIKAGMDQNAFIFKNHPHFPKPDGTTAWYPEHEELYKKGWIHGIEVVNGRTYFPHSHQWCLDKKLTMIGNSDVHDPINMNYDFNSGEHRPVTLVFAKAKTKEAIKEALFDRRTAIFSENLLIGEEQFLKPIFTESIEILNPKMFLKGRAMVEVQIRNKSDVSYQLTTSEDRNDINFPKNITLRGNKTVLYTIWTKTGDLEQRKEMVTIPYLVKNLLTAPDVGMPVELVFDIEFAPADTSQN